MIFTHFQSREFLFLSAFLSCFVFQANCGAQEGDGLTESSQQNRNADDQSAIAKRIRKSIVTVTHRGRNKKELGLGTGFFFGKEGWVATNLHVLGEARPIVVTLSNGIEAKVQSVHASDQSVDLAILKLDVTDIPASERPSLRLGENIDQGAAVMAFGHPSGLLNTFMTGYVSGLQRIQDKQLIQVSMPIDHGSSGGPLLNAAGEVVGIITYKSVDLQSTGFAMPVAALKTLQQRPNPIEISRWVTIGRLPETRWTIPLDGEWSQRAGKIHVSGAGSGFGGRSLCLLRQAADNHQKFEVSVEVKLDDESGAAGIAFQVDKSNLHYAFYPSGAKLRLSRFDGPNVFSWQVLKEIASPAYRLGTWNQLQVSVKDTTIICSCNGEIVCQTQDNHYQTGQVGLVSFRGTEASFRRLQFEERIDVDELASLSRQKLDRLLARSNTEDLTGHETRMMLEKIPGAIPDAILDHAHSLEMRTQKLKVLARLVHEARLRKKIDAELQLGDKANLAKLSLLLAKYDNPDVEVEHYLDLIQQMAEEIKTMFKGKVDSDKQMLKRLDQYLFEDNGYHGSRTNYYVRSNSYLNEVIDDREGLPITLAVLYLSVANQLGLNVRGIGTPGHFIVASFKDGKADEYIDVFAGGVRKQKTEIVERVESESGLEWDDEFLAPQTNRQILNRMIRNLQRLTEQDQNVDDLLRYTNLLVVTDNTNEAEHRFLRTLINSRLQHKEDVKLDLEWFDDHSNQISPAQLSELKAITGRLRSE